MLDVDWREKASWLGAIVVGDEVGMWQGSLRPHLGKVTKITKTRRMTVVFDGGRELVFDHEGDLYPRAERWSTAWVLVQPDAAFRERLRWFDAEDERRKLTRELENWANANAPTDFDHNVCNAALRGVLQQLRAGRTTPESDEDQRARQAHEAQHPGALITGSVATGWLAMTHLPSVGDAETETEPDVAPEVAVLLATEGGRTAYRAVLFTREILELLPGSPRSGGRQRHTTTSWGSRSAWVTRTRSHRGFASTPGKSCGCSAQWG